MLPATVQNNTTMAMRMSYIATRREMEREVFFEARSNRTKKVFLSRESDLFPLAIRLIDSIMIVRLVLLPCTL